MPQPNILLILTDHFRRDALGHSTPNLMALAADGTQFDNAYCVRPGLDLVPVLRRVPGSGHPGIHQRILSHRVRTTQFTHAKEEQRVQRVRT